MKKHNPKLKKFFALISPFPLFYFLIPLSFAATNIDAVNHYGWNDNAGWLDFYGTANVLVYNDRLEGYLNSSLGFVALNCGSTPNGNICGTSNFKVSNDGNGNLTGWAWSDAVGWISFDSGSSGSSFPYEVTVNPASGDFSGWAWNDNIGWISMNCANLGTCGTSNYKVNTAWRNLPVSGSLNSSVYDTQVVGGSAMNSIMWQGSHPAGTSVSFQIASSNSASGPWNYIGPDGSSATYYTPTDLNVPAPINLTYHNNMRYFRYKMILYSDAAQSQSPRVDKVIISWSP